MLSVKNPEVDALLSELMAKTGKGKTELVKEGLQHLLAQQKPAKPSKEEYMARVRAIVDEIKQLPVLDDRSPDEIIGYDEYGLPT